MSVAIIIDDRDTGIIYSTDQWEPEESSGESDGTNTVCSTAGATATYQFDGATSVSVWGTLQSTSTAPRSSYSIDNGTHLIFNPGPPQPSAWYRYKFFDSGPISSGAHTLVISTLDPGFFYLDFIMITTVKSPSPSQTTVAIPPKNSPPILPKAPASSQSLAEASVQVITTVLTDVKSSPGTLTNVASMASWSSISIPSSAASTGIFSISLSSMPSGMVTVFLTPTSSASGASAPPSSADINPPVISHHTSIGAIVGSVIGGLILFAFLLGIIFLVKRRRQNPIALSPDLQQQAVSPFMLEDVSAGSGSLSSVPTEADAEPPRYYSLVYSRPVPEISLSEKRRNAH